MRAALARVAGTSDHANVLLLSGGGSHGAWGSGVLAGWPDKPRFDVVTGVSTGALQCSHAFLGDYETLGRIYQNVSDSDIFRKRFLLTALLSDSLTSLDPLRALIERELPDATIDKVAEAGAGRGLFCASTNLDNGRLKVWDLVDLARQKDYKTYRAAILASCSVPGLHSPVLIGSALHADGGVREQVFIRRVMLGLCSERKSARGWNDPRVTVYVLVNGKLDVSEVCAQPRLFSLVTRAVEILTSAGATGNLLMSKTVAEEAGAQWRLCRIPASVKVAFGSQSFDTHEMRVLYRAGVEWGRRGEWEERLPVTEDSARGIEE
jgi:hypothetical protein